MGNKAAILLNLGSPDSTNVRDVRRYLSEFLMDKRVIDAPFPVRWFIVNCMILPYRPKQSAEHYKRIWGPNGSPLVSTCKSLQRKVQQVFDFPIELAMRYGNPATGDVLRSLHARGVDELLVFPLYPHYAMSSYETAVAKVTDEIKKNGFPFRVSIVEPFYEEPGYIDTLLASAKPYLQEGFDRLLFSFHGIPERHIRKSDPGNSHCLRTNDCCQTGHAAHATCYRHQCFRTAQRFAEKARITPEQYQVSFQSRLGRDPWLKPYTDQTLELLGKKGTGRVLVICPAFVADCLETLEEIAIEGQSHFLENGGGEFQMIPCLNTHPRWTEFVASKIRHWSENGD